ncbi:MAG: hypothetical protein HY784_05050 [Chloroflexi bacterium]|nr:hypothetical protein [Chloroflexota bacterium]
MTPTQSRNFRLGVLNGALFNLAEALMDPTLVLVAFVSALTSSPVLIGLIVPLRNAGWFLPQLYVSTFLQGWQYKKPLYAGMAVVRALAWGGLAVSMALVRNSTALLALFIGLFAINSLASGFAGLSFMSVVAKTIPADRRTDFFAWRLTGGGALAIGAGFVVRAMLAADAPLSFPQNYLLLFALAFAFSVGGLLAYNRTEEPPDVEVPPGATFRSQLRRARRVLATDLTYQAFLKMRMALMLAGVATPFFVVWARESFGLPPSWVGVYLAIVTAAGLLANLLFSRLSRRVSNQALFNLAALAGLVMALLVLALAALGLLRPLSARLGGLWLAPVFVLSGVREAGIGVTANSLLLDLAPAWRRPLYVGLTHTVLGLILLATAAGGLVVALSGPVALFVMALLANVLALWYARQMKLAGSVAIAATASKK